ncbi:MAG TPA: DUF2934 domain-containing protein [Burkholderiales bacterium]
MASKQKSDVNPGGPATDRPPRKVREAARPGAKPEAPRAEGDGIARLSEDELNAMISRAAYLRAERRGFEPGHEVEDWLAAEAEIRATMSRGSQQNR